MISKKEQEILALNDPVESYNYCYDNKDANIKLHEDIIVNNKDACYAFYFALKMPGTNIEKLQEIVINSGSTYYIFNFAFIENSNKEELFKAMLKSGDEDWINLFIKDISLSQELKELVIFI